MGANHMKNAVGDQVQSLVMSDAFVNSLTQKVKLEDPSAQIETYPVSKLQTRLRVRRERGGPRYFTITVKEEQ